MRIGRLANVLGTGRDGPVHAENHRIWDQAGVVDGLALCQMFKQAIRGAGLPKYLSSDHDPLYRFHQWEANLRILEVREIKTVPYVPWSHPFIERLIGTIRRECLDRLLFWTA